MNNNVEKALIFWKNLISNKKDNVCNISFDVSEFISNWDNYPIGKIKIPIVIDNNSYEFIFNKTSDKCIFKENIIQLTLTDIEI